MQWMERHVAHVRKPGVVWQLSVDHYDVWPKAHWRWQVVKFTGSFAEPKEECLGSGFVSSKDDATSAAVAAYKADAA